MVLFQGLPLGGWHHAYQHASFFKFCHIQKALQMPISHIFKVQIMFQQKHFQNAKPECVVEFFFTLSQCFLMIGIRIPADCLQICLHRRFLASPGQSSKKSLDSWGILVPRSFCALYPSGFLGISCLCMNCALSSTKPEDL